MGGQCMWPGALAAAKVSSAVSKRFGIKCEEDNFVCTSNLTFCHGGETEECPDGTRCCRLDVPGGTPCSNTIGNYCEWEPESPTSAPSPVPTSTPTAAPTAVPTPLPSAVPTSTPSATPTSAPTTE